MATLADFKNALIKAHQAGDETAAKFFADEIMRYQAQGRLDSDTIPIPKAEPSFGQKAVAAGKAAVGVVGGGAAGAATGYFNTKYMMSELQKMFPAGEVATPTSTPKYNEGVWV